MVPPFLGPNLKANDNKYVMLDINNTFLSLGYYLGFSEKKVSVLTVLRALHRLLASSDCCLSQANDLSSD